MKKADLRYGFTTGACAAAAAKGAALMLREQEIAEEVELTLPAGVTARFCLHGQNIGTNTASCYVINDAGDVLTALHVVTNSTAISLTFADGSELPARILAQHPENDTALLRASQPPHCSWARQSRGMIADSCRPSGYFAICCFAQARFSAVKENSFG